MLLNLLLSPIYRSAAVPVSTVNLNSMIGVALDIDGVVLSGSAVLPHAANSVRKLQKAGIPMIFVTNGGGVPEHKKAAELSAKLNTTISPSQIVLSHTPMRSLAETYGNKPVLVLGKDSCVDVVREYGYTDPILPEQIVAAFPSVWPFRPPFPGYEPVDTSKSIGSVIVCHDPMDWGRDIQLIYDLIRNNGSLSYTSPPPQKISKQPFPIFFSNGDLEWSNNMKISRLGQGSFITALSHLYYELTNVNLEYRIFGKPHLPTYTYARTLLENEAERIYGPMSGEEHGSRVYFGVGDNIKSDIDGANGMGWNSVLVKTGIYKGGDHPADYLFEHIGEAVDFITSLTEKKRDEML